MKRSVTLMSAFVFVLVAVVTWRLTIAMAQTAIPNYAYLRDSSGQVWAAYNNQRVAIPIYPATDAEIAAIPWSGLWLGLKADGTGYEPGPKPDWAVPSTTTVAAAPPLAAAVVRLGGDRGQNTAPFNLSAGNYVAAYRTDLRPGQSSCFTAATLYRVEGKRRVESIYSTTLSQRDGQTTATGETRIYGVAGGDHFVEADETGCSWSVEIRPL